MENYLLTHKKALILQTFLEKKKICNTKNQIGLALVDFNHFTSEGYTQSDK